MELDEAIYHALNGDVILFVGSGFSVGAINQNKEPLKIGNQLSKHLFDLCDIEFENEPIDEAVGEFIEKFSSDKLIDILKNEYIVSDTAQHHETVLSIDWKRIYTTNYDDIIEKVSDGIGKHREIVTLNDSQIGSSVTYGLCLHLNGRINRLNIETLQREFKLTEKSYLTESFINNEWISLFRDDLKNSKAVIFIGYSLNYDLDIKRVLFLTEELKNKCFFITCRDEKKSNLRRMANFGIVYQIGVEEFGELIEKEKREHSPIEFCEKPLYSFSEFIGEYSNLDIKDDDVYNLLVLGQINISLLYQSLTSENRLKRYAIKFDEVDTVIKWFDQGIKNVILHSDLGNGKTVFTKQLMILCSKQYKVFELTELSDGWEGEIEYIANLGGKKLIIIENYSNFSMFFKALNRFRSNSEIFLFLTERTLLNTLRLHNFDFSDPYTKTIDLNHLKDQNIDRLISLFNHYSFIWGKHSSLNFNKKSNLIKHECNSSFQNVLINIVLSENIIERFADIYSGLNKKRGYSSIIMLSLLNSALSLALEVDEIVYLLDSDNVNDSHFREDPVVREIISFKDNSVSIKNPVLAKELLSRIKNLNIVFERLIQIAIKANNYSRKPKYFFLLRKINSYTDLRFVFGKHRNFSKEIIHYFEKIKNLKFFRENSHFWLQYAIARLELKEFGKAERCFDSAYSYCKDDSPAKNFIDNHYSRFLLEYGIFSRTKIDPYSNFIKAHELLMKSRIGRDDWDYTFKVAINYEKYCDIYIEDFSNKQKAVIKSICEQILDSINDFKKSTSHYHISKRAITSCESSIKSLIGKL